MNRQALVGFFTLVALIGLFAIFLVLENVGTQGRYKIGVHFQSAAGLHKGALVYESGVIVGVVDQTSLLPEDFTVEVILAINNGVDIPRDAKFLIAAPLTGDTTLEILPPRPASRPTGVVGATPVPVQVALLPREVLPIQQQPQGESPPTISELLQEGQGEVHRLDRMLAELEKSEPELLGSLQGTLDSFNQLAMVGSHRLFRLADRLDAMTTTLQGALDAGSKHLVDVSGQLDGTVRRNSGKIDDIVSMLDRMSVALNETADHVRSLAADPKIHRNLLDATSGLAETAKQLSLIAADVRNVTGDPQTQAQLRNSVANLDASSQKLNSLLGVLGGQSAVYGVDAGATPAPVPSGREHARSGVPGGTISAAPSAASTPAVATQPQPLTSRIGALARNLVAIQLRVSELDRQIPGSSSSPYLTAVRGPQTDVNAIILPDGRTSLFAGANDIGTGTTTWNVAALEHLGGHLTVGGGVLYSNLGLLARYDPGLFGVETRLYDLSHPTLDVYGNLNLRPGLSLFGGERDIIDSGRRTAFGLQLQF